MQIGRNYCTFTHSRFRYMYRISLLILFFLHALIVRAQISVRAENPGIDTLEVVFHDDKWAIIHSVVAGDNVFKLSRMYHVPPALLADENGINFQTSLNPGQILYIPYGPFNQATEASGDRFDVRPLRYQVQKYDNLFRLAHLAGVQQRVLQKWNGIPDNYIEEGRVLFVGWVLYDISGGPSADTVEVNSDRTERRNNNRRGVTTKEDGVERTVIVVRKSYLDTLPEVERTYMTQTNSEQVVMEEKGTAVFFENKGKLQSSKVIYAFHNTAKRGTIIKVYNPGTGKTVFVKVLGPIPDTKMYHNSVIGIGNGAKELLMVTEDKAWCELKYAPAQ